MSENLQVSQNIDAAGPISETCPVRPLARNFQITIEHLWLGVPVFALVWKSFIYPLPVLDFWWQTPVGAADFIHRHHLNGNIFHPQIFGHYLIWKLWPEQRSFFDGRVHLYGLDFVRRYSLLLWDSHWEDLLAGWNIKYLLFHKSPDDKEHLKAIQAARASSHWRQLYEDDISVLFEKAAPSNSE